MHEHHHGHSATAVQQLPSDPTGLPEAARPEIVELDDGETFDLEIFPVAKRIGDATVRMLTYNGSIPGPTLEIPQSSTVTIHVTNRGDLEATVHWHGLRLENRFDGTHDTQAPIPVGETFTYEVTVPDPGAYWYHPHIREDYGQEMGLYGNILVVPAERDYWPPANRELPLTLDDILIEDGRVAPFSEAETTHVAMGRFGNVMLVSGETDLALTVKQGEVVRFYLTNTANTRVFNVTLPGVVMKLVGADSGHYEHEEFVEDVLLAPSERVVVDVHFRELGQFTLEHRTPERSYRLAGITVTEERVEPDLSDQFEVVRTNADMAVERERLAPHLAAPPDKRLAFVAEMDMGASEGAASYACPMHPEVVSEEPGKCPKCGMRLLPAHLVGASGHGHGDHGHHDHGSHEGPDVHGDHQHHGHGGREGHHGESRDERGGHGHAHAHGAAQGIEWEDDMVEVNRLTTVENMRWKLVDRETGAENAQIAWRFRVGDRVKIRLVNEMDSDHPMPHPFHVHGAGRFLILSRDGVAEPNLVWKDTVLVRTGETVDILLDVSNAGRWMAHCHIAEHHESGMMFSFEVSPADGDSAARADE
jgi:FtsP/CotA-like multicopper oxidase with cupredoxin domain